MDEALFLPEAGVHRRQAGWPEDSALVGKSADHLAIVAKIRVEEADRPGMLVAAVGSVGMSAAGGEGRTGLVVPRGIFGTQCARQGNVEKSVIRRNRAALHPAPIPQAPFVLVISA